MKHLAIVTLLCCFAIVGCLRGKDGAARDAAALLKKHPELKPTVEITCKPTFQQRLFRGPGSRADVGRSFRYLVLKHKSEMYFILCEPGRSAIPIELFEKESYTFTVQRRYFANGNLGDLPRLIQIIKSDKVLYENMSGGSNNELNVIVNSRASTALPTR